MAGIGGGTSWSAPKYTASQKPRVVLPSIFRVAKKLQEGKKLQKHEKEELENTLSRWGKKKENLSTHIKSIRGNKILGDFFQDRKITYADQIKFNQEKIGDNSIPVGKFIRKFGEAGKALYEILSLNFKLGGKKLQAWIATCSTHLERMLKRMGIVVIIPAALASVSTVKLFAFSIGTTAETLLENIFPYVPPNMLEMFYANEYLFTAGITTLAAITQYSKITSIIRGSRRKAKKRRKTNGAAFAFDADDFRRLGFNPGG